MKEYFNLIENKLAQFGPGPWIDEPDKVEYVDETTQLACLIIRNQHGNLCGYVGVPLDSKLAGIDCESLNVEVHGGITYANKCQGHICHDATEEVYWFGFDCGHACDHSPYRPQNSYETYRDVDYVKTEIRSLAQQIKALL